ncbi:cob(I)alamin adenosyltransferase [Deinococcus humi]|uniref:Cob(I)alamin adenosyltransferase n=1 Tax=Deinococcus humi TaxID=662880 RepID=A0A7W8JZ99_9DEIO|nr:cob(I)alamin adenosyltransferase [Deinococcus humi]
MRVLVWLSRWTERRIWRLTKALTARASVATLAMINALPNAPVNPSAS